MDNNNNNNVNENDNYTDRMNYRLKQLLPGKNREEYREFYKQYSLNKRDDIASTETDTKSNINRMIDNIKTEKTKIKEIIDTYETFLGADEFEKRFVNNARDNQDNRYHIDQNSKFQDISYLFTSFEKNKKFEIKDYNIARKKFEKKFNENALKINSNVFDWMSIDPYQDNIGSVKSLIEFFFNFMMCYKDGDKYYLPLPDEWTENNGILDNMMNPINNNLKNLKEKGIPLTGIDIDGNRLDPGCTRPFNVDNNNTETWEDVSKIGAYYKPFLLNYQGEWSDRNDTDIYNECYSLDYDENKEMEYIYQGSGGVSGIFGYELKNNNITEYNEGDYFTKDDDDDDNDYLVNNKYRDVDYDEDDDDVRPSTFLSAYTGNVCTTLYDIIYSNSVNSKRGDDNHQKYTGTSRTAYNAVLLDKVIKNNGIDLNIQTFNSNNHYKKIIESVMDLEAHLTEFKVLDEDGSESENGLDNMFENVDPETIRNLWFANPGGYLEDITKGGNTPAGLLTARYNGANDAHGDFTNDFTKKPFYDSVPNDEIIKKIIEKFAEKIFEGINRQKYLINNNKENYEKFFAERLSRSIIIVKNSLFCAPVPFNTDGATYNPDDIMELFEKYGGNNKYFGGRAPSDENPGSLFGDGISDFGDDEKMSSKTGCKNSQPLTLSLTTMFRKAFTKMMNKAILTRHFNVKTYKEVEDSVNKTYNEGKDTYGGNTADILVKKFEYIAGCGGEDFKPDKLVKLDVSDILTMQSGKFTYIEYLRLCLNSEKNILNQTINKDKVFRRCTAGVLQLKDGSSSVSTKYLNKKANEQIVDYLRHEVLFSKIAFINHLENIDNDVNLNKQILIKKEEQKILNKINPYIEKIKNSIHINQINRANSNLSKIKAEIYKSLELYSSAYNTYKTSTEIINNNLTEFHEQLKVKTDDIDYSEIELHISKLYEKKQKIINNFNKIYNREIQKIIVIINKSNDMINSIKDFKNPTILQQKIIDNVNNQINNIQDEVEIKIPGLITKIINKTDMDKLTKLDNYVKYILKDRTLFGGVWVPIVTRNNFFVRQYKIFNIFTGELIELNPFKGTDLTKKNIKGKILISYTQNSKNWYYYQIRPNEKFLKNPKTKNIYLEKYRKELFEKYEQPGFFDVIRLNTIKKSLYSKGKNISFKEIDKKENTPAEDPGAEDGDNRAQGQAGGVMGDVINDNDNDQDGAPAQAQPQDNTQPNANPQDQAPAGDGAGAPAGDNRDGDGAQDGDEGQAPADDDKPSTPKYDCKDGCEGFIYFDDLVKKILEIVDEMKTGVETQKSFKSKGGNKSPKKKSPKKASPKKASPKKASPKKKSPKKASPKKASPKKKSPKKASPKKASPKKKSPKKKQQFKKNIMIL